MALVLLLLLFKPGSTSTALAWKGTSGAGIRMIRNQAYYQATPIKPRHLRCLTGTNARAKATLPTYIGEDTMQCMRLYAAVCGDYAACRVRQV